MSATIDQQFIEFIVKSVVGKPDAVKVERRVDEKGVLLELTVDAEDLGRVIGKRGATAQSLRTLLRALGTKNDARYNLKIVDVNGGTAGTTGTNEVSAKTEKPKKKAAEEAGADPEAKAEDQPASESASPVEEPEAADEVEVSEDSEVPEDSDDSKDETSDVISKARKELADLDDLDI